MIFAPVDVDSCYVFRASFIRRYMKAGAMLGDFFIQGISQLNLFDDHKPQASSWRLVDSLKQSGRGKYGSQDRVLRKGGQ